MPRSVLENVLGGGLGSVLGMYLEASWELTWEHQSSRLGVCHREQLGAYSKAGWECATECNQERTSKHRWERATYNEVHLAVYFQVVCSVMYTIQCTKLPAYHSDLVNLCVGPYDLIVPRVKYAMNYHPKHSYSMSYALCKVIFPGECTFTAKDLITKRVKES
jgi:hypothetical protein